jgi:ppGpp synthetase/RelA/SpoT-type nucleotidyltranferase
MSDVAQLKGASLEELKAEYEGLVPTATRFCGELKRQIEALVVQNGMTLTIPVEARVKSWDSIASKIARLSMNLYSVKEIQDVVGVRAVLLFQRDSQRLSNLIASAFTVLRQEETAARLKQDRFGYSSTHLIVTIPEDWLRAPTLCGLRGLQAEIQVRTASQHIWATASQALQYKNEASVPLPVRRSIHRVAAILETVDLEFERVLAEREEYRSELNIARSEPLNADSIEKLLDSLLPPQNKEPDEAYSVLVKELADFDICTTDELKRVIQKHLPEVLEEEARLVQEAAKKQKGARRKSGRAVQKETYYIHVGLARVAMQKEFAKRWQKYMYEGTLRHLAEGDPRRRIVQDAITGLDST